MSTQTVYELDDLPSPTRLAVIGHPIAHSKSPQMHEAALAEASSYHPLIREYCDVCPAGGRYVRLLCATEGDAFEQLVRALQQRGFIGVNVTIPFKRRAYELADQKDSSTTQAKAANTLLFTPDGRIIAHNTDNEGFIAALREFMQKDTPDFSSHHLLILGACGGAGTAIALRCAEYCFASITLVNRPRPELDELDAQLQQLAPETRIQSLHFDSLELETVAASCDIIVNASSLGLKDDDLLPIPTQYMRPGSYYYDIITHPTALARAAEQHGCHVSTGESMLLWQGALAFRLWFEHSMTAKAALPAWYLGEQLPRTSVMRAALAQTQH